MVLRHFSTVSSSARQSRLPLFPRGRGGLLDPRRLGAQLASVERRTSSMGHDRIDHPVGAHDDLSNSTAGALIAAADQTNRVAMVAPIIVPILAPMSFSHPGW